MKKNVSSPKKTGDPGSPFPLTSLLKAAKDIYDKNKSEKETSEKEKKKQELNKIKKEGEEKSYRVGKIVEEKNKLSKDLSKSSSKEAPSLSLDKDKKISYNKEFKTKAGDIGVSAERTIGSPKSKASINYDNDKLSAGGSYDWDTKKSKIDATYKPSKDTEISFQKDDKDLSAGYKGKNLELQASRGEDNKIKTSGSANINLKGGGSVSLSKDVEGNKSASYENEEKGRSLSLETDPKNKITKASGEYTTKGGTSVRGSISRLRNDDEDLDEEDLDDEGNVMPATKSPNNNLKGSLGATIRDNKYDVSFNDRDKSYSASAEIGGNKYGLSYDKSKNNLIGASANIGGKDISASYSPIDKSFSAGAEIGGNKYNLQYSPGSLSASTQIGGNKYRIGYTPGEISGGATIGKGNLNLGYDRENKNISASGQLDLGRLGRIGGSLGKDNIKGSYTLPSGGTITGGYSPNLISAAYNTAGGSAFNANYNRNDKRFNVGANINLSRNKSNGSYGADKAKELNKMIKDEREKKKT